MIENFEARKDIDTLEKFIMMVNVLACKEGCIKTAQKVRDYLEEICKRHFMMSAMIKIK